METGQAMPAGMECPNCAYDLTGSAGWRCAECGREVTAEDVRAFEARRGAAERVIGLLGVHAIVGFIVCAVMGAGAGVVSARVAEGVDAAVVCAVAIGGAVMAGVAASRLAPAAHRGAWLEAWLRTHVWLHIAWLTAPLSGALVLIALWEKHQGHAHSYGWLTTVMIMGPLFWLLIVVACAVRWLNAFRAQRDRMRLRGGSAMTAFFVAAMLVGAGAGLLGLAAGALSARTSTEIMPLESWPTKY